MESLRQLYRDQLTEAPKRASQKEQSGPSNHLGWVFVCNDFAQPKAVRTYSSLFQAQASATYFTPNTFYRNDQRHAGTLRWLNALVIDIDVKIAKNAGMIYPDVMEMVTTAGLPTPSLIVQTPSGGFHVYWYLAEPRRAFPKVVEHYKRIQQAIAEELSGDLQAVGAERWFRLPTPQNTVHRSAERVSFDALCNWYSERNEELLHQRKVMVRKQDMMQHPAIQSLLQGVEQGRRDNTCYTLALAFKATGYSEEDTQIYLYAWNERNTPAMRQLDVKRKVKSAFKEGAPLGPSAYWIETLSGMEFKYQLWEGAKPREERTYSHLEEWKEDVLSILRENGGILCGAQRDIAKIIYSSVDKSKAISYATFKRVIELLIQEHLIEKTVEGRGRAACTTIKIISYKNVIQFPNVIKSNGLNPYTFIDTVVGGSLYQNYGTRNNIDCFNTT
ncbi:MULTISPECIES: primase C-terminal domain-containing protein [Exiguobacterium]|uniref:primase C-terminal domain-containing protein n=1 Tax=Exiguobacterium TaxID=33986 RepID=UPI001BEA57FC|nr:MULTISPECIES: primase C-terminal domain-containing protein [Exiguobacterium]